MGWGSGMDAVTRTIQTRLDSGGRPGEEVNMKKLFISQPMVDRTDEEIFKERETAIAEARKILGEDIEVIDSYCREECTPLGYLAYSIIKLSEADVAYIGKGWQGYRGCRIEHECAAEYGIGIIC